MENIKEYNTFRLILGLVGVEGISGKSRILDRTFFTRLFHI